jgi:Domain of unknown function (DUF4440)
MRKIQIVLLCAACLFFLTSTVDAQEAKKSITNADVVEMVTAGLSEQIIITSIRQATARDFDLTPAGLIALKKAGVPDTVVLVMQEVNASAKSVSVSGDKFPARANETSPEDSNEGLRQELVRIEHQLAKAAIEGDRATIDRLLADEFMQFEDGKSYSKAWFLKNAKPLKHVKAVDIENTKVSLDGGSATLTGIYVIHIQNSPTRRDRFINKYVKTDGRWQMSSAHMSKYEAPLVQPKPSTDNGCSGIESLGIHQNTAISAQIGGGVVEWLAKIRNNTAVTKIVVFGWRDMYGQQQTAQVQIRGGEIASVRLDLTQARVIPPVVNLQVLSCQ